MVMVTVPPEVLVRNVPIIEHEEVHFFPQVFEQGTGGGAFVAPMFVGNASRSFFKICGIGSSGTKFIFCMRR